jgi:hypothetical protein
MEAYIGNVERAKSRYKIFFEMLQPMMEKKDFRRNSFY